MTCDCCGRTEVDRVTHVLVEEAVLAHVAALDAKAERDAAAWQDAETASAEALRSAHGR